MTDPSKDCTDAALGALLLRYEVGALVDEDRDRFEMHLMDCSYCHQAFEEFKPVSSALRQHKHSILAHLNQNGISFDTLRRELKAGKNSASKQTGILSSVIQLLNFIRESFVRPRVWAPAFVMTAACIYLIVHLDTRSSDNPYLKMMAFEKAPYESQLLRGESLSPAAEYYRQGMNAYVLNDYSAATKKLRKAVELEPKQGTWWLYLGISCYLNRRGDEAITALSRAETLTEYEIKTETQWYLAQAHLLAGHPEISIQMLKLIGDQSNPYSNRANDLLRKIKQQKP